MGELARRVRERLRDRLAGARRGLGWPVEHRVAGTRVALAGPPVAADAFDRFSYAPIDPPKRGGDLPDDWRAAVDDATVRIDALGRAGRLRADHTQFQVQRRRLTSMDDAVIVDAVRTPFGDRGGAFRDTHAQDLAAAPLEALESRNSGVPAAVDDVYWGCVTATGEQGINIGRVAPMVAGWGDSVPGVQLNRMCGSSQQAVTWAAGQIRAGFADVVVAGGSEHLTRVPMGADSTAESGIIAREALTDTYFEHYDEATSQGEGAERMAEQWGISRERADRIAADSHRRWGEAWKAGHYDRAVVPVETTLDGEPATVDRDEHPRPDSTVDSLAGLPLAFRPEGEGVHHAGNSSGVVDGASALVVASEQVAADRGWDPLARVVDSVVVGVDPVTMLTGPVPATEQVLERAGHEIGDVDLFEVNEAFASVVAAWLDETGAPWERTNVLGGAIAHGHPFGATGGALLGKLAYELDRRGADLGLCAMCIGFGQGIATLIERA